MKRILYSVIFLAIFLTACSFTDDQSVKKDEQPVKSQAPESKENKPKQAENNTKTKTEDKYIPRKVKYYEIENPKRTLTDIEKELLRYPGVFSGDRYDEAKVNETLDKLPDNLTEEQYLEEMLYLLSEDYHEEVETFVNFDFSFDVNVERPDETINSPTLKTAHYAILIDASGSMEEMVGNKTRIEAAKEAVLEFAKQVPEEATISMRVYGHKGSGSEADKKLSCGSSEKYYEGNYDSEKFKNALNKVKPAGWTPIALALETVKDDIPKNTDDVVVYVVSDGIETCGGNPVKAAKDLVSSDIETIVNIIGFDVDNEGKNLLKKVASAGNGEFTYVDSERELKKYMREQYEQIQKSWLEWKEEGKEQSIQIKERMKKLALSTKESMKKKSEREKERLKSAQAYLKEKYNDREHPSSTMFSKVVNYANEKWRYAVDTGNEAWKQAVDSGNQQWKEYVEEGNKKMNEAGEKKKEHSE